MPDEVHREEGHHEAYRDVQFRNQDEQSLKMFYHYQAEKKTKKKIKGQGRIRYQIGLSSLFQSHQAQLYIERKLLLM